LEKLITSNSREVEALNTLHPKWMTNRSGIYEFKEVPDSLRGYGIFFRHSNSVDITPFVFQRQWLQRLKLLTGY
jgi:hypothetical protein